MKKRKRKKILTRRKSQTRTETKIWKKKGWTGMIWNVKQQPMTESVREMVMRRFGRGERIIVVVRLGQTFNNYTPD